MASIETYKRMQRDSYESPISADEIVGNFAWHEAFPYETQLLYRNGDLRRPLLHDMRTSSALDFGCGPGRMIRRMSEIFKRVDGVDISKRLLEEAKRRCPNSNYFHASGDDLGDAPSNTYDFVYSTIALQHIAVRSIRQRIFMHMSRVLRPGGVCSVQLAFNASYPYVRSSRSLTFLNYQISISKADNQHALWHENRVDAKATNSGCDVVIDKDGRKLAVADMSQWFTDVSYWYYDVQTIYNNLDGHAHNDYWPTHWFFLSGRKPLHSESDIVAAEDKSRV